MAAHAPIRKGYSIRILIIAVALIGGGLWFLYDGLVGYPRQQEIYEAYQQIREDHDDWRVRWAEVAAERGWPVTDETPQGYSDTEILVQRIFAAVLLPLGALVAVSYLRLLRRWISSDEAGLRTSWGARVPWEAIQSLDKQRWQRKGIAVVRYEDAGTPRRITLDDWKYDTAAIERIVSEVEAELARREAG